MSSCCLKQLYFLVFPPYKESKKLFNTFKIEPFSGTETGGVIGLMIGLVIGGVIGLGIMGVWGIDGGVGMTGGGMTPR